jgi:hypothetical protein
MMIKKNVLWILIAAGIAAAQSGVVTSGSAQTIYSGIGSSALTLQLGQAVNTATPSGLGLTCLWSAGAVLPHTVGGTDIPLPGGSVYGTVAIDPNNGTNYESGTSWVAWTPVSGSCNVATGYTGTVYAYLQTDSVVGNRCLFQTNTGGTSTPCTIVNNSNSGATSCGGKIWSGAGTCADGSGSDPAPWTPGTKLEQESLPAGIAALFTQTANQAVNFAGTDIRPEDAQFATQRITAPCSQIGGSQYYGLGYTAGPGNTIQGLYTDTKNATFFNIVNWTLPTSYSVYRVGATPIIVAVNQTDGTTNGFANTAITNIDSNTLAQILDGTLNETQDVSSQATGNQGITVLMREPLSGTYNTMEFNVPNTTFNKTSQDFGATQQSGQQNCGASSPSNPMNIATGSSPTTGARQRVIGTGDMIAVLGGYTQITTPTPPVGAVLGYAFWSTANFSGIYGGRTNYKTNARYLTVDGVDPLLTGYGETPISHILPGVIPTPGNGGLADVTLTNVADGSYPIWSFLRLVCIGAGTGTGCTGANNLATVGPNFVTFGTATSVPDFVPVTSTGNQPVLSVVRSHFTPPAATSAKTVGCTPVANGTATGLGATGIAEKECGGDVGGEVLSISADQDYIISYQALSGTSKLTGQINQRR